MHRTWIITVVVALGAAGIAFWLGRSTAPAAEQTVVELSPEQQREAEEAEALRRAAVAETGAALSAPQAREAYLVKEIEKGRVEVEKLEAEIAALKESAGPEGGPVLDDAAEAATRARYVYEGTEKALTALDLDKAGEAYQHMTPLIHELLDSLAAGKPKMHLQQDISKWNMTLVNQAVKMQGGGLSGNGINGVFTHPAIQVNYIYAALKAGEQPLSEKQEAALNELGDRFVKEEARRVAGHSEQTFELEKLVGEAELKSRFYADVDAMLTSEQVNVLHPESMRGRIQADLFSSGLIWAARAAPVRFKDRTELASSVADNAMRHLQLGAEHEALVRELAVDYAAGFSNEFLDREADALDKLGLFHESRVRESAARLVTFLKALADRLPVDDDVRKSIQSTAFALIPSKRS